MGNREPYLLVIGCNHRTTPLDVREQVALDTARVDQLYDRLREQKALSESMILHTCNRLELYGLFDSEVTPGGFLQALSEATGLAESELSRFTYVHSGLPAVVHLFSVATGLDSQMIGETEIFGQVKSAYSTADRRGWIGPIFHRLLQKTFQAAKWTRTHTQIGQGQTSLGNVTVELAERIFGPLKSARTLIVGSGEVGQDVAKALTSRGVKGVAVSSRRAESSLKLASEVGGESIPFAKWKDKLRHTDIVIFATSAPGTIFDLDSAEEVLAQRGNSPLFVVDLAVPRDVEPAIGELGSVYLYNFEDLAEIANANRALREAEVSRCLTHLEERASALAERLNLKRPGS